MDTKNLFLDVRSNLLNKHIDLTLQKHFDEPCVGAQLAFPYTFQTSSAYCPSSAEAEPCHSSTHV